MDPPAFGQVLNMKGCVLTFAKGDSVPFMMTQQQDLLYGGVAYLSTVHHNHQVAAQKVCSTEEVEEGRQRDGGEAGDGGRR